MYFIDNSEYLELMFENKSAGRILMEIVLTVGFM